MMEIRKITHGGLAAFTLMGLLVTAGPSSAQWKLPGNVPLVVFQPTEKRVTSPKELLLTLYDPNFTGRVIVPYHAQWDLSGYIRIPLRSGVSLIGEREPFGR